MEKDLRARILNKYRVHRKRLKTSKESTDNETPCASVSAFLSVQVDSSLSSNTSTSQCKFSKRLLLKLLIANHLSIFNNSARSNYKLLTYDIYNKLI